MVSELVTFGELLRHHRLAASLSQEALAEQAGLSVRGISDLERGARSHPYPETIRMLADALRLDDAQRAALRSAARRRPRPLPPDVTSGKSAHLPVPLTRLIDRENEVATVSGMLHDERVRLVTLTGPGGVGKTRLALAVADRMNGSFTGGKIFVDLATLQRPASVPTAIASALGIPERGGTPLAESLPRVLGSNRLLVLLDNYEHLIDAAPVVADMLSSGANVKALVTSREALHVRGEHEYIVSPLSLPHRDGGALSGTRATSGAMQLFGERAAEADATFQLTPENAGVIAAICRRLDGLPLAIELAAAWIKLLPPATLLERLEQRLPLLTSGPRDAPARQRTLRNAIAWSFDLLSIEEQAFFSRLSVFTGGWDLVAAERVANRASPDETLALLGSMVDKSLVWRGDTPTGSRFMMLETIREFASSNLSKSPSEEFATQAAHADHFLHLAEEAHAGLVGEEQERWLALLDDEDANVRSALDWTLAQATPAAGLRFTRALWRYWSPRGKLSDGRYWLERALARTDPAETALDARADAHNALGNILGDLGEYASARLHYESALALRRATNDSAGIAGALNNLGIIAFWFANYDEAEALHRESLQIRRTIGDRFGEALSLGNLGDVALARGEFAESRRLHESSMQVRDAIRDATGGAYARYNLGDVARLEGNLPEAEWLLGESLARFEGLGDLQGIAYAEWSLADVASARGDTARAIGYLKNALETRVNIGDQRGAIECLETLAMVAIRHGLDDEGLNLIAAARGKREALSCPLPPSARVELDRLEALARRRCNELDSPGEGRDAGEVAPDILAQRTFGLLQAALASSRSEA